MNPEPKPALMSQSDFARHRGKSRQYVSKLAKAGVLILRGGKVDVRASDAVLDDKPIVIEAAEPAPAAAVRPPLGDGGQQSTSFAQARTVDQVYKAKLRKLQFETQERKLIPLAEVEAGWSEAGIAIRDAVMGLAPRVCNRLPAEWRAELSAVLDDEARKVLRLLSDDIRNRKTA